MFSILTSAAVSVLIQFSGPCPHELSQISNGAKSPRPQRHTVKSTAPHTYGKLIFLHDIGHQQARAADPSKLLNFMAARGFDVDAIDLPGFSNDDRLDLIPNVSTWNLRLENYIQALKSESQIPLILVGQGASAPLAIALSQAHANLFKARILLNPLSPGPTLMAAQHKAQAYYRSQGRAMDIQAWIWMLQNFRTEWNFSEIASTPTLMMASLDWLEKFPELEQTLTDLSTHRKASIGIARLPVTGDEGWTRLIGFLTKSGAISSKR